MSNLKEISKLFLKLGTIAFGGPAAHIAMMEEEVVSKRKWMDHQHFLDLIGVTNLVPGPNSTEMTMHCGYERGGWKGLFVAGLSFILPAVLITCVFAWLYAEYGKLPEVEPFIYGIKPAVIAVILSALYKLGKKALKSIELGVLGGIVVVACLFGFSEITSMLVCGLFGVVLFFIKKMNSTTNSISPFIFFPLAITQMKTFLSFLKIGAILYGSGYVLFAFLDAELVSTGLLTRQELMDAIAVGQITPGPVLTTASFIGWQLAGWKGAVAATLGIFLPSFFFVAMINPLVDKIRKSPMLSAFLDAVNIAAVGVILAVCVEMGMETLTDWRTITIAVVSIVVTFGWKKVNSAFIVLGGAVLGYALWMM